MDEITTLTVELTGRPVCHINPTADNSRRDMETAKEHAIAQLQAYFTTVTTATPKSDERPRDIAFSISQAIETLEVNATRRKFMVLLLDGFHGSWPATTYPTLAWIANPRSPFATIDACDKPFVCYMLPDRSEFYDLYHVTKMAGFYEQLMMAHLNAESFNRAKLHLTITAWLNGVPTPDTNFTAAPIDNDELQLIDVMKQKMLVTTLQDKLMQAGLDTVTVKKHELGAIRTFEEALLFDIDKSVLTDTAEAALEEVGKILRELPEHATFRVHGHTDSTGTPDHNMELSGKRAARVRHFLINHVQLFNVQAEGFGEMRPRANNGSAVGRALNRRVEIIVSGATNSGS